ncbi:MAG: folate-binding protein YgfZ [Leptolyngbyaceae cyanobacterium SL_1_1]|nr:folate-binding protein YgfZ [Leptolyngbyaceae cyanobacterium RM1_1_2]NJO08557.1 folate-binding protein YgfZ [Leptolyngbyaceae cyanobacterium SL_1_1]
MRQSLAALQKQAGAVFDHGTILISFGNDEQAYQSAQTTVAIADRSHWGKIRVSDSDRLRFLHNQTTNDFQRLQPGQGCDTAFVTSTARMLDLVSAYVQTDSVWLLTSPGMQQTLIDWMDRYIFFADQVRLENITDDWAAFSLLGPQSDRIMADLGAKDLIGQPHGSHQAIAPKGTLAAVGSGLASPGYTLLTPIEAADSLWQAVAEAGAVPLGEQIWQRLRIEQGRPMPGTELTEAVNPLEAGLWQTISFEKGCYIGQETIARLNTYHGVKQQLWGIHLDREVPLQSPVSSGADKIGTLTSLVNTPAGIKGLAYIRTKAGGDGLSITVGEAHGTVVDLPFLSRGYLNAGA